MDYLVILSKAKAGLFYFYYVCYLLHYKSGKAFYPGANAAVQGT
jgi:hypothetical protein